MAVTTSDPAEPRGKNLGAVLGPAAIGAIAGLVGVVVGAYMTLWQTGVQQGIADRQAAMQVAEIRRQIIGAGDAFDKATLELLLEHTLKPIDPHGYEAFRRALMDLIATKAASSDPRSASVEAESQATVPPLQGDDPKALVALFNGPDRLRASNALLELYKSKPTEVVAALIAGVLPYSPHGDSYRINLYVAFTLARLRPAWRGSAAQLKTIENLRQHGSYRDPTFKLRVDQALANYGA